MAHGVQSVKMLIKILPGDVSGCFLMDEQDSNHIGVLMNKKKYYDESTTFAVM